MDEVNTKIRVLFELKGTFDPDVLTQTTSILPFKTWRRGDVGSFNKKLTYDYWCLDSGYITTLVSDDLIKDICNKIKFKKNDLISFIKNNDIEVVFMIVSKIDGLNTPGIVLYPDIVLLASELGASIELDLYVNPKEIEV